MVFFLRMLLVTGNEVKVVP